MELEEAKKEVSEIIRKVIHTEEVYYLNGKYVRWGRVEKDLHAVLERLLVKRAPDRFVAWIAVVSLVINMVLLTLVMLPIGGR